MSVPDTPVLAEKVIGSACSTINSFEGQRTIYKTPVTAPVVKPRAGARRVKRFDLSDPAAVLVTLEILGKPRALRDFDF